MYSAPAIVKGATHFRLSACISENEDAKGRTVFFQSKENGFDSNSTERLQLLVS